MTSLATLRRPNAVSIYARDFETRDRVDRFLIENTVIRDADRVRLHTTQSASVVSPITVTRNPLERAVADNIRIEPRTLTVTGTLSATPLGFLGGQVTSTAGSLRRIDLQEVAKLRTIQLRREPVDVVTPYGVFESMAMQINENHGRGNKVDLTLVFTEIRIVSPFVVQAELDIDQATIGAQARSIAGSQPTDLVDAPSDLAGGLGG